MSLMFQPVKVVAVLSMMVIFAMGITAVTSGSIDADPNHTLVSDDGKLDFLQTDSIEVSGAWLADFGGQAADAFAGLFITLFTLFLMWKLVKMSAENSGNDVISGVTKGMTDLAETAAKAAPIIPGGLSVSGMQRMKSKSGLKKFTLSGLTDHYDTVVGEQVKSLV